MTCGCLACGEAGPGASHLRGVDVPLARRPGLEPTPAALTEAPPGQPSTRPSGLDSALEARFFSSLHLLDCRVPHTHNYVPVWKARVSSTSLRSLRSQTCVVSV